MTRMVRRAPTPPPPNRRPPRPPASAPRAPTRAPGGLGGGVPPGGEGEAQVRGRRAPPPPRDRALARHAAIVRLTVRGQREQLVGDPVEIVGPGQHPPRRADAVRVER